MVAASCLALGACERGALQSREVTALPPGFTQTNEGAPSDFGETRVGDLIVIENRTGALVVATLRQPAPAPQRAPLEVTAPVPATGRVRGPSAFGSDGERVGVDIAAVGPAAGSATLSVAPGPWGAHVVVSRDAGGALRVSQRAFIPPEHLQPPVSMPSGWEWRPGEGASDEFRLRLGDDVVVGHALGHRVAARIEATLDDGSVVEFDATLPSRGVATAAMPASPVRISVEFRNVPLLTPDGAGATTYRAESEVGRHGWSVRMARDASGVPTSTQGFLR